MQLHHFFLLALMIVSCTRNQTVQEPFIAVERAAICEPACAPISNGPLTPDKAVALAIQNNPALRARFEEIGISYGSWVNASKMSNPNLEVSVRFPDKSWAPINTDYTLTLSFLDYMLRPAREQAAAWEFQVQQALAGEYFLRFVADVRIAFYEVQAAAKGVDLHQKLLLNAEAAAIVAEEQEKCGNINRLEALTRKQLFYGEKQALLKAQTELVSAEEKLNVLMGLCGNDSRWTLGDSEEEGLSCLEAANVESIATAQRLDLAAAGYRIQSVEKKLRQHSWWAYTDARVGVSTEKDTDGVQVTGPVLQMDLPLFNSGEGDRIRLQAELRKSLQEQEALQIQVASEARAAFEEYALARQMAENSAQLLAQMQEKVEEAQTHYNFMSLDIYELLAANREALEAEIAKAHSRKALLTARAKLDRALGGLP